MNLFSFYRVGRFLLLVGLSLLVAVGCDRQSSPQVVVYTSVDQVISEPVLKAFEKQTGIRVKPVYDVEATKTTGLVNRLIAEKSNPQADVFWNSEIIRTLVLKQKGVLMPFDSPSAKDIPAVFKDPDSYWVGFAGRARVLVYNTDLVTDADAPKTVAELADPKWRGQAAIAYPLFGTTSTHVATLYGRMGEQKLEKLLRAMVANDIQVVDGNGLVRDLVVAGNLKVGLTDTDDAQAAIRKGQPIRMVYPDQEGDGAMIIPNTVARVAGGPNPEPAQQLINYLLSQAVEKQLAFMDTAQIPFREAVPRPPYVKGADQLKVMTVDYHQAATDLDAAMTLAQAIFAR